MKHLLVLAPTYTTFIKDQVEALALYWDKITVMVRHNPVRSLLKVMGGRENDALFKGNLVDYSNVPDNVRIHIYGLSSFRRDTSGVSLGRAIAKKVVKIIREERLSINLIHAHFAWPMGYAGTLVSGISLHFRA